jgi:hypothetical protein
MHNHLSKIFYFTNSLKDNRIKFNNKKISIIYRNYKEIINPLMIIKARKMEHVLQKRTFPRNMLPVY